MPPRLGACLVAEFVGAFALTCVGVLAIHNAPPGNAGLISIALAHGLILAIGVTAAMPTSGGHLNPAVTIGFLLTGRISPVAGVAYIIIQLLGATSAALLVFVLYGAGTDAAIIVKDGTPVPGAPVMVALLAEIVATFLLGFAIWGSAVDPRHRNVGGFAIGLTIAADILAFGPISGASMNPSRSFGPTLIASLAPNSGVLWRTHWIYWVGPIIGASLAALVYHLVMMPRSSESR
ncbi:MAG: MIP/aquaporin family protein [Tepidisphaeraceae bacterium]